MTAPVTIWHNPRCSKSRQTLELLRARAVEPKVVQYLDEPPSEGELSDVLAMLGVSARELMRTKEPAYKELGLGDTALSEKQLISKMAANPVLIERPVVMVGKKAALGRPPENILPLLGE